MAKFTARLAVVVLGVGVVGLPTASAQFAIPGAFPAGATREGSKFYPDESKVADALLRNAASHVRDGQWAEAVEIYQRVIQQFGDTLAQLPKDDPAGAPGGESRLYVDVRQYCQRRLAALPPEARALYRGRVDAEAERLYRQGVANRDRGALRRVVAQSFCSSWGDDALDLLGDLAFQDGRFAEALAAYRQLVPDQPGKAIGLVHPDPSVDLSRVAAKKLLCRAAIGEDPPGPADLAAFEAAYPQARGSLAGRDGPLTQILREAIAADHLAPSAQLDARWPTFAGSPARTKVVPGAIDVGSFQWRVKLEPPTAIIRGGSLTRRFGGGIMMMSTPPTPSTDPAPAFHPIVLNDQVVVCDDKQIVAYNLNSPPTGPSGAVDLLWRFDNHTKYGMASAQGVPGPSRFTMTASGDRIFARMGPVGFYSSFPGRGDPNEASRSVLVAVERSTQGKLLWKRAAADISLPKRPADGTNHSAGYEGAPIADSQDVYIALTEAGTQTTTWVACLDAESGETRWVRYVGTGGSSGIDINTGMPGGTDLGSRLLSLDGGTVYYQTNLGAVAALDAETGAVRWVATYPRQDRPGTWLVRDRELNPAVIHDGLALVSPDDTQAIFAFDTATGRLVWKTPLKNTVNHLLGVAKGRLIATGNHVWAFDVKTGKLLWSWPDDQQGYEGFGRGLLAGDQVYWPTKTEIHVLDQANGLRADRPPIKLMETFKQGGGNLAVGDGYLIVAQADGLAVFCQNSRLIERYREEIAKAPEVGMNYFRLARVAEAVGDDELALKGLGQAVAKARSSEMIDGQPLSEVAWNHRFQLLMKLGSRAAKARDWAGAASRFASAAEAARAARDRLDARLRLAEAQDQRGAPRDAVATLQGLLADEGLRPLTVPADEHRTVRADLLIADRLAAILDRRGRGLYDEFDQRASDLLEKGKAEKDPRQLEEVGRAYPAAKAVPEALLALARLYETLGRPADAAHAYKRLLANAPDDPTRARALWGLARAYESQKLWVPARDAYLQSQSRFADIKLEEFGTEATVGLLAAERLARAPFHRMTADHAEPILSMPLARRWSRRWEGPVKPMAAEGVPPSAESSRIFLAERTTIRPVDPNTGEAAWTTNLGAEPIWVGYLADRVIAAAETRISALSLDKGVVVWRYDQGDPTPGPRAGNPFAKADAAPQGPVRFHDFRVVGGRIFCRRGDRELLAFDGDTGLVDWSFTPGAGELGPHLWIGPQRIALQVRKPNAVLVLETDTGRRRAEFPRGEEDPPWEREPFAIDDDHLAVVSDWRTVALFDLNRGVNAWTFREGPALPRNGPPRLVGDAERLLALYDGNELIRLDPKTGGKLWSQPLGTDDLSEHPEAMALDGERFYWVSGPAFSDPDLPAQLEAIKLADGRLAWRRFLTGPSTAWAIALTRHNLAAYPSPSKPAGTPLGSLPLVFCRRDTGELVQRLVFPAIVSEVAVRLAPRGALVATQGGLWALGERPTDGGNAPR